MVTPRHLRSDGRLKVRHLNADGSLFRPQLPEGRTHYPPRADNPDRIGRFPLGLLGIFVTWIAVGTFTNWLVSNQAALWSAGTAVVLGLILLPVIHNPRRRLIRRLVVSGLAIILLVVGLIIF